MPVDKLVPHFERALSSGAIGQAFTNERLKLCLELWSDYHRERSLRAKFLTLVMALEVLTSPLPKHEAAQALLDQWGEDLESHLAKYPTHTEEHEALESLKRELIFRRERSIRSRLRHHVLSVVTPWDPAAAPQLATLAVLAYDLRGTLVHNGTLDASTLSEGHDAARQALRGVVLASLGIRDSHEDVGA